MPKRLTTQEFVAKAKLIHGDKYQYDKSVYTNNNVEIIITCPIHGDFKQRPRMHMSGCGCPECYGRTRKDTMWFIEKAQDVHRNKYDYSETEYTTAGNQVVIICPKHGKFSQIASQHLRGHGCPKCYAESLSESRHFSQEEFIERAIAIHGTKYDYSITKYRGMNSKVNIICPTHGVFSQYARTHVCEKRGCLKCAHDAQKTLVYGIGVNDLTCEGKSPARTAWEAMLQRCYTDYGNHPTYHDCSVCDEWLLLSNFKSWFENPENGYREGYHLDKDIIVKGNRIYSPQTCCLVPRYINEMLVSCTAKRGKYPQGVYTSKCVKGYIARIHCMRKGRHLGVFQSVESAFCAYKSAKEAYIKEIATEYFNRGEITKRVYDALMRYEVEVTD